MAMKAGNLRHIITIQSKDESAQDSQGAPIIVWTDFATVHASVEPLSGRELFVAQAINSETKNRMRLRYLSGITYDMRVSFKGKLYNITGVMNKEERDIEIELMTTEGLNDG